MAFQARADYQNHAIGWLHRGYSSLGGGKVVRFPRIWMVYGECRIKHLARQLVFRIALTAIATSVCITVAVPLSSSIPATAQSNKFDGEWLAQGKLSCTPKGHDSFEAVVTILNSQLSGKFKGIARDYEIIGSIGPGGRLDTGHLLSPLLGYAPVLRAVGKLSASKGNISYSSNPTFPRWPSNLLR